MRKNLFANVAGVHNFRQQDHEEIAKHLLR